MSVSSGYDDLPVVTGSHVCGDYKQRGNSPQKKPGKYVHKKPDTIDRDNGFAGRKYCNIAEKYMENGVFGYADVCDKYRHDRMCPVPLTTLFDYKAEIVLSGNFVL